MSVLALLLGLLLLAYLGSALGEGTGTARVQVLGCLALGVAAGPRLLGWVDASTVEAVDPIARAGLGWLAFTHGIGARTYDRAATVRQVAIAVGFGVVAAAVAALTWNLVADASSPLDAAALVGLAAVGTLAGRRPPRAEAATGRARFGPVSVVNGWVAFGLLDLVFALRAAPATTSPAFWLQLAAPVALGCGLGLTLVAARRAGIGGGELRALCIGATAIAIGASVATSVPAITTAFVVGRIFGALSRGDDANDRAAFDPLVRGRAAVVLPMLVLAGLAIPLTLSRSELFVAGAVVLALWVAARMTRRVYPDWRPPQREVAISLGFAAALQLEGSTGALVLLVSALVGVTSELWSGEAAEA